MGLLSKKIAEFKQGMAQEAAELGVAERKQRDRERRRRDAADPVKTLSAASEDDKKLLAAAADKIETLQAECDKLAAERDQALAERDQLQAERDKLAAERDQAQAELADNKDMLAAFAEDAEKMQAEWDQLAEVLKLPGMKTLLANRYSRDKHPEATEDVKRAFDDYSKKINVAYDLIKQEAKKSDEAA